MSKQLPKLTEEWLSISHREYIDGFTCKNKSGNSHVQDFLQEQALELMDRNLVRTRLFFDRHRNLIGFYSLFNDTIKINKYKRSELGVELPGHVKEIPAINLHYIGIDDRYRERSYGNYLMASVIVNCIKVATISGCTLITLEATEDVVSFYERFDFIHVRRENKLYRMALSTKNMIKLFNTSS